MKFILIHVTLLCLSLYSIGQQTRFALVKPDGTTSIYSDLTATYNAATNGDAIYLPGGVYSFPGSINKKLFIYGAGCYQDSSQVTNRTILTSSIHIQAGADGGSLNGCYVQDPGAGYFSASVFFDTSISNYTISYCYLDAGIICSASCSSLLLRDNVFGTAYPYFPFPSNSSLRCYRSLKLLGSNNLVCNNIFFGTIISDGGNSFRNNIFHSTYSASFGYLDNIMNNENFYDNIFSPANNYSYCTNSTFNNNLFLGNGSLGNNNWGANNQSPSLDFTSLFNTQGFVFANYHFNATAPNYVNNMASDNGPVGIYGGLYPVREGWIPDNPHMFYKTVDAQSNNQGKLPIHFKVSSGN